MAYLPTFLLFSQQAVLYQLTQSIRTAQFKVIRVFILLVQASALCAPNLLRSSSFNLLYAFQPQPAADAIAEMIKSMFVPPFVRV